MIPVIFSIVLLVIFLGFMAWAVETWLVYKQKHHQKECPHCGKRMP
jgi:hypothetical protein